MWPGVAGGCFDGSFAGVAGLPGLPDLANMAAMGGYPMPPAVPAAPAAPQLADAKAHMVDRIKEWQRRSPAHKRSWDNYCMSHGIAKFDPSKKEDSFLRGFLELADAGLISLEDPGGNDDPAEKANLVEAVKQWQRLGQSHKQAWWNYCNSRGTRDYDPVRHDVASLLKFKQGIESGLIKPDDTPSDDYGKGGKGGFKDVKEQSSSGGGKGKGDGDWGGMGKGEMMMMMGMMLKGMMKGKAAGMSPMAVIQAMQSMGGPMGMGMPPPWAFGKGWGGSGGGSGGGGGGAAEGRTKVGEIRYDDPQHAKAAIASLDGSTLAGSTISVAYDTSSMDGTKLLVSGVPAHVQWQDLKDHFKHIGTVAFAGFKTAPSSETGGSAVASFGGGGGGGWDDAWSSGPAWGGGGYGPWSMWGGGKGKGWGPY